MTDAERRLRLAFLIATESAKPKIMFYWISFSSIETGFLGVVIVKSIGPISALQLTQTLGINPGGTALTLPLNETVIPDRYTNRLLSRQEAEEVDALMCLETAETTAIH